MTLRYRRAPELRLSELEGEGVVLHLGTRRYFSVSETGLAILEALEEPRTVDELVAVLIARYEIGRAEAARSARDFLNQCVRANLLIASDEP